MELILASGSATRHAMLEAAGVPHRVVPSHVDEDAIKQRLTGGNAAELAGALAQAKALAVKAEGTLVLGGDSVLEVNGRTFDKPRSRAEAIAHLAAFSGQRIRLVSAAALAREGVVRWTDCGQAVLQVRPLSEAFIEHYVDAEWPALSQSVGCFRIEGPGVQLFERVEGDYFTILGMPLLPVLEALRAEGIIPG